MDIDLLHTIYVMWVCSVDPVPVAGHSACQSSVFSTICVENTDVAHKTNFSAVVLQSGA